MLILFLGPGYGRLEFQPLDSDSIDPYEVGSLEIEAV